MSDDPSPDHTAPIAPAVLSSDRQTVAGGRADALIDARAPTRCVGEGLGEVELSLSFVDEDEMEDLHVRYMDEPGPTDVLSFPLDARTNAACAARRRRDRAGGRGARTTRATRRPSSGCSLVHGVLHLLGLRPRGGRREGRRCGRGRNATAGCGRRDLDRLALDRSVVICLDRRRRVLRGGRGRDHADEPRPRVPARARKVGAAPVRSRGSSRTPRRT